MKFIALTLIFFVSYILMIFAGVYLLYLHLKDRTKTKKEERIIFDRWQRILNGEDIINDVFYPLVGNKVEIDLLLKADSNTPFSEN